jgi:predicted MFS family arabinose efflux permease
LFALASLAGGLADSQAVPIGARAIQGLARSRDRARVALDPHHDVCRRRRAQPGAGHLGCDGRCGGAAGVLLGGLLTDLLGWRWILFINVPIGLVVALIAQRLIAEGRNPARTRSFDLLGALSATLGLSILVLGIIRTDVTGWGAPSTLALVGAGVLLLLAFLAIEGRLAKAPLMPLRIYASRTLSAANVVVLLVGGATFGMWFFVSLYLQQVLGYSPIKAGLAFLPMTLLIVIGSTVASRAVTRIGAKPLLVAGMIGRQRGCCCSPKYR